VHDRAAVARQHPAERRPGAVHEAVVVHIGDTSELLGLDVHEPCEHRREGDVHPHVDVTEALLHRGRGVLHLLRVGHVDLGDECRPTCPLDVQADSLEPGISARQQGDAVSAGESLAEIHARTEDAARFGAGEVLAAYEISDVAPAERPVLLEVVG